MKADLVTFFLFFGVATVACAATQFLLIAMVGKINRKRDTSSQISSFAFSWTRVWREYGTLYPDGIYRQALVGAASCALVCFLITFYYLFVVLPKYSPPSR